MKRTRIIYFSAFLATVYIILNFKTKDFNQVKIKGYDRLVKEYSRLKVLVKDFQFKSSNKSGIIKKDAETVISDKKFKGITTTTAKTITVMTTTTTTITTSTNRSIITTSHIDIICEMNHEDEEREYMLSLTYQERMNLKSHRQKKIHQNGSVLSEKEFGRLLELDMMDSLRPDPIQCKDNRGHFNTTVFADLTLFYVTLDEEFLPVLKRNESCFHLIGLNIDEINCTYSYVDSDVRVKDAKWNISLTQDTIHLENPYNGVGVACSSPMSKISHLLDPLYLVNNTKRPEDRIPFYSDIFMFANKTTQGFQQMKNAAALPSSPAFSVFVLCLDSTSRTAFLRNLPLSTRYLMEQGGVMFNRHHRQGENSYPNVMPVLSGRRILYEENAEDGFDRGKMDDIVSTNNMTWAWEPWAKVGLPTMHHEDMAWAGVYNYHYKKGWRKKPFMYYQKSAYDAMDDWKIRNGEMLNSCYMCINNSPQHLRQLSFLSDFVKSFHSIPNFSFTHLSEYSHDRNNYISLMDADLQIFLKILIDGGFFDRTLFILMGDHGRRGSSFARMRSGWLDANSPLLLIRPPPAMKLENPDLSRILRQNKEKLTTMQDIFKTITDPIITRLTQPLNHGLPRENEGLSLLQPLPSRTCEKALVPDEFCTCPQEKKNINTTDPVILKYAEKIVDTIIEISSVYKKCHNLSLHHIEWGWGSESIYHLQIVTSLTSSNVPKFDSSRDIVSCGNHMASFCSLCPQGHGAGYCNGDCIWINNKCRNKPVSVSCGGHNATTCSECPQGRGEGYCNGDCHWQEGQCIFKPDEHYDDLPTFHAVFDVKTWPKVEIRRTDWYSKTSSCITDDSLDSIRPFCICPR